MTHPSRRDKSSALPFETTEGATAAAASATVGATARVKNVTVSHKAPSNPAHMSQGGNRRRTSNIQPPKASSSQANESSMSESESQKKKNKLDYTRSSVACAHCRRRKIRCAMNENDPKATKCKMCIKFNKECVFQPIDQQHMAAAQVRPHASGSSARRQSSSVASSPTDMGSDEHSYGAYTRIAPHVSGSQQAMLQSYTQAPPFSGSTVDPSGTIYQPHQAESPWPYHSAFQQSYHGLPHPHYTQQYSPYIDTVSTTGDFSPYPVYSPTTHGDLYTNTLSTYMKPEASIMQPQITTARRGSQWPSANMTYPHSYLQPITTTATLSQSASADPAYYSGTSDSTQAADVEAWFSSYGLEDHFGTPPDAKPYGGRSH